LFLAPRSRLGSVSRKDLIYDQIEPRGIARR
jgi:hypothetical protein